MIISQLENREDECDTYHFYLLINLNYGNLEICFIYLKTELTITFRIREAFQARI